jgi:hypothetical protein
MILTLVFNFRRKLAKIAENLDHNIDPWTLLLCIQNVRAKNAKTAVIHFLQVATGFAGTAARKIL